MRNMLLSLGILRAVRITQLSDPKASITNCSSKGIDLGLYTTSALVQDVRPFVTENAPLPQVATGRLTHVARIL